jgi:tetratricopeptide (TPR) repeat protein
LCSFFALSTPSAWVVDINEDENNIMKRIRMLLFAAVFVVSSPAHGQGFGTFSRKVVTIHRLLPATVNLNGKRIRVESLGEKSLLEGAELPSLLKTKLVTMIQKDPRFILNEEHPQTILRFTITNCYVEEWTVNVGTNTAHKAYRGKIEVSYQAIDVATNAALDSENLTHVAGYEPTKGPSWSDVLRKNKDKQSAAAEMSSNETRDQLVSGIVESMGRRVAPTEQPFEALLPVKKLEPLSSLAISHRWGALEEQAEKMDKLAKPEDDSYRLYLAALAKEAEAYDLAREANDRDLGKRTDLSAQDAEAEFLRAQKYMDEARKIYKDILEANPKEKEFRPGDARTEEAVTIYATIARYKEEYRKAQAASSAAVGAMAKNNGKPDQASENQSTPLEQVLEFCKKGLAADSVKEYIQSPDFLKDVKATNYKFNFAKDPIALSDSCKQNASLYQRLMRDRLASASATKGASRVRQKQ